jgi:hypothetical protein
MLFALCGLSWLYGLVFIHSSIHDRQRSFTDVPIVHGSIHPHQSIFLTASSLITLTLCLALTGRKVHLQELGFPREIAWRQVKGAVSPSDAIVEIQTFVSRSKMRWQHNEVEKTVWLAAGFLHLSDNRLTIAFGPGTIWTFGALRSPAWYIKYTRTQPTAISRITGLLQHRTRLGKTMYRQTELQ